MLQVEQIVCQGLDDTFLYRARHMGVMDGLSMDYLEYD